MLQLQFNKFIFEYEQQEYVKEGIHWDLIQFQSNQSNIDIIDKFVFARLDDECITSRGSDAGLMSYLYTNLNQSTIFTASSTQKSQLQFSIKHYAGTVMVRPLLLISNRLLIICSTQPLELLKRTRTIFLRTCINCYIPLPSRSYFN